MLDQTSTNHYQTREAYRGSVNTVVFIDDVLNASYIKLWMLFMCGCGICSGLLLFGYSIMSALGNWLTQLSPYDSLNCNLRGWHNLG